MTLIKGREMGAIVAYEKLKIGVLDLKLASLEKLFLTMAEGNKKCEKGKEDGLDSSARIVPCLAYT